MVLRVSGSSGFHWKLGLTFKERKIVIADEYFQGFGLFVGNCGFLSGL